MICVGHGTNYNKTSAKKAIPRVANPSTVFHVNENKLPAKHSIGPFLALLLE